MYSGKEVNDFGKGSYLFWTTMVNCFRQGGLLFRVRRLIASNKEVYCFGQGG